MTANSSEQDHAKEIRRHAHRLAAEGLTAALNMWELDRYYSDEADQASLESALLAIIARLRKQGGAR